MSLLLIFFKYNKFLNDYIKDLVGLFLQRTLYYLFVYLQCHKCGDLFLWTTVCWWAFGLH